jgi:hypothetical protein
MQSNDRNFLKIRSFCLKWLVATICFILITLPTFSQGPGEEGGGGPGGDPGGDPDLIPIDGGLGFLLAAGVGYGVKKARDFRRKK